MAIKRLFGGQKDDDDDDDRRKPEIDVNKLRSRSLAEYVDLEKKKKYDQEKKLKQLQRKKEEMREIEKKLKRAQEAAEIDIKAAAALLGQKVSSSGSDKEKAAAAAAAAATKEQPMALVVYEHPAASLVVVFIIGVIIVLTSNAVYNELQNYAKTRLVSGNNMSKTKYLETDAKAYIDDGVTAVNKIYWVGVSLVIIGVIGVALFYTFSNQGKLVNVAGVPNSKTFFMANSYFPTMFYLLVLLLCVYCMYVFYTTVYYLNYYNDLLNSSTTALQVVITAIPIALTIYLVYKATEQLQVVRAKQDAAAAKAKAAAAAAKKK